MTKKELIRQKEMRREIFLKQYNKSYANKIMMKQLKEKQKKEQVEINICYYDEADSIPEDKWPNIDHLYNIDYIGKEPLADKVDRQLKKQKEKKCQQKKEK